MKPEMADIISSAGAMVLATTGPHGLNAVPVSVVAVEDGEIHLYDFFMRKTAENIKVEPTAVLTCWKGQAGFQIKAEALYESEGEVYELAVAKMKERFPERTLAAVIRLVPVEIYDVAPGATGENLCEG